MPGPPAGEVLFVTSSYPRWPGDSTTPFVHHLALDLRALGWDVQVMAPHAPGAARDEVLDGVPVHRFRYAWPQSLECLCYGGGALVRLRANRWLLGLVPFLVLAQFCAVLLRLLRRRSILVHSHWLLPQGFAAGLAARLAGRPQVATVHGSDVFALRGAVARWFKRLAIGFSRAVTVNSRATCTAVLGLAAPPDRIELIPMGASVDSRRETGVAGESRAARGDLGGPLLAFIGRLVPEKGVSDLLQAVAKLARSHPDVAALVIGDGPARAALEREAQALGIAARVRFLGWLPQAEAHRYLRAAAILVAPSRPAPDGTLEGQGLALAEAMLAGVPVVATAIGGFTDAIRHGETGLLVNPGSPAEIAEAVRRLVADPPLARRLSGAARALAEVEYTRDASARRFSDLYWRLVDAPARPSVREKI
jgi:glycosyltransferase involved in cell wall biosynthesis